MYLLRSEWMAMNISKGGAIISLVILAGVAALDVRSFFITDFYRSESTSGKRFNFAVEQGYLSAWDLSIGMRPAEKSWWEHSTEPQLVQAKIREHVGGAVHFNIPLYWLIEAAGIFPAIIALRWYSRRRAR